MAKKTKMTWQEIIERIEQAPKEMQTMVAKAYIRDDIDNENVQYLFNTDGLDVLNETGENENIDAVMPDGIGAGSFSVRTYKPGAGNKNFITTGSGGWSTCIKGYPQDSECNVLANCVGYASGRFNEIINNARETQGCAYKTLNCNAWYFKEMAEAAGLKTGSEPRVGAIMCWGKTGDAGHVAVVERVINSGQVYTSESGYGSSAFWNSTRYKGNGNWGAGGSYYFRCFIYLPDDVQKIVDGGSPTPPTPTPTTHKVGEVVNINGVYVSSDSTQKLSPAITRGTITKIVSGARNPYLLDDGNIGWVNDGCIVGNTPAPAPTGLQVGDKVKIVGYGNGSSYGSSNTAGGIGWTRFILKIWDGRPYPYQVGDSTGTTGFYKADALKKL